MCSRQESYSEEGQRQIDDAIIGPVFPYIRQKSVNAGQIIPVFTIVWDDGSQRAKEEERGGHKPN
jgi:hypothetical protein